MKRDRCVSLVSVRAGGDPGRSIVSMTSAEARGLQLDVPGVRRALGASIVWWPNRSADGLAEFSMPASSAAIVEATSQARGVLRVPVKDRRPVALLPAGKPWTVHSRSRRTLTPYSVEHRTREAADAWARHLRSRGWLEVEVRPTPAWAVSS